MHFLERSLRKLYSWTAQKAVHRYIQKERRYSYKGLRLVVYKDVFHPGFFRSTLVFAEWLEQIDLDGRKILELGCGTGLLSLVAARKGAVVTAVDINTKAVSNAALNARNNHLPLQAFHSDLFSALSSVQFDMVLINPPYFPKAPSSDYEHAWFCGEHFSYFERLFDELKHRSAGEAHYIILSDNCDLAAIDNIASANGCRLETGFTKKVAGEIFIIYKVHRDQ